MGCFFVDMPNDYFSFKQFTIKQDKCAMKVCTDSCLFGAVISTVLTSRKKVLDIGSGTGLLSLMYAQKNICEIDAVEINENAFLQAKENIAHTQFENKISLFHQDIKCFNNGKKYDLIISNPPFFKNSLKSKNTERNDAMHNDELSYQLLVGKAVQLLENDGIFAILIPFYAKEEVITAAGLNGLFLMQEYNIKQSLQHNYFRTILFFSFNTTEQKQTSLAIKNNDNNYTEEFIHFLKDYYLFL